MYCTRPAQLSEILSPHPFTNLHSFLPKWHNIGLGTRGAGGLSPSIFWVGGWSILKPPKIPIPYKKLDKKGPKIMQVVHQIQKFLRQGCAAPLSPQNRICINFDRKGTEIVHLWFPQIHILLWKEGLPLATTRYYTYFCKRPKRAWNYAYLARKIQNFLRQGAQPLCNPQNRIYIRKRAAPLWPPEIIYFCKFLPKRAWNYAYLARKIPNFLRQGGAALATPKSYSSVSLDQKRAPKFAYSAGKDLSSPLQTPNHIFL